MPSHLILIVIQLDIQYVPAITVCQDKELAMDEVYLLTTYVATIDASTQVIL